MVFCSAEGVWTRRRLRRSSVHTAPTTMGLATRSASLVERPDTKLGNTEGELYGQKSPKFDHMLLKVWSTGKN